MAEILTEQELLIFIQLGLAAAQIHISGSQRAGNGSEEHQNGCKSRFFHGDNVLLLGAQGFPHPFFYFFAGAAGLSRGQSGLGRPKCKPRQF